MSGKPIGRVTLRKALARPEPLSLDLPHVDVLLLDTMAQHRGQSLEQVIRDALHLLFVTLPREGDG